MQTLTQPEDDVPTAAARRVDHLYLALGAGAAGGARWALDGIERIAVGRGDARAARRRGTELHVTCPDPWMSSAHLTLVRERGHWVALDAGSRNGFQVNGARQTRAVLLAEDVLEAGRTFFLVRTGEPAGAPVVELGAATGPGLVTLDPTLAEDLDELTRIARARVPVLIAGPTGAGKERVARAIHTGSGRAGPLVAVNCGALPAGLVESELFGHKKGAFSGAVADSAGLIVAASGGTLFLDELGDLPPPAQAALLRVLEEHEVRAVGATAAAAVDLRLVCATHRDLEQAVDDGRFREDLLARVAGFTITLPALAERRVDLGLLVGALVPPTTVLAASAARALFAYAWPRNVRELARVLERAVALADGGELRPSHLPDEIAHAAWPAPAVGDAHDDPRRAQLVELLERHRGNVSRVAADMGRVRQQVQRWLKSYGIDPARYR
ncbi:MAG: sigma 54-interacting transcriptional regulator [Kofleriaceae bacterium]